VDEAGNEFVLDKVGHDEFESEEPELSHVSGLSDVPSDWSAADSEMRKEMVEDITERRRNRVDYDVLSDDSDLRVFTGTSKQRIMYLMGKKMSGMVENNCLRLNKEQAKKQEVHKVINDLVDVYERKDIEVFEAAINFNFNTEIDNFEDQIHEQRLRHKLIYPKLSAFIDPLSQLDKSDWLNGKLLEYCMIDQKYIIP
jgi:hypothetical protein